MKLSEIQECMDIYRRAVGHYQRILEDLVAAREVADGLPILRRTQRRLDDAVHGMTHLGAAVSLVPELAEHLLEHMEMVAAIKSEALRAGVALHSGIKEPEEEPEEDSPDDL